MFSIAQLLAQSDAPTPEALASWLKVLFYLGGFACTVVGGLVGIKSLRTRESVTPQPLVVQEHLEFATKAELERVERDLVSLGDDMAKRFDSLDRKRSESIRGLHEDLRLRAEAIRSEMKTDNEKLHSRVTELLSAFSELKGKCEEALKK